MTFSGTTDEVRPVLMSAQLGERPGGGCTKTAVSGIDGEVDCVLTTWSEEVEHADDACRAVLALIERLGDRGGWDRPARPVDHTRDPAHRRRGEGP